MALVGHWPLNEGSGTTANDTSGNSLTGTINNGSWSGGLLQFNGTSTYVSIASASGLNVTSNYTISVWINTSSSAASSYILAKGDENSGVLQYRLGIDFQFGTGEFTDYWDGSGTRYSASGGSYPATNTLLNFIATADVSGNSLVIYKNGSVHGSGAATANARTGTDALAIGCRLLSGSPSNCFVGTIQDVQIWNETKNSAWASATYAAGPNPGAATPSLTPFRNPMRFFNRRF